jgi:hypothetical protein
LSSAFLMAFSFFKRLTSILSLVTSIDPSLEDFGVRFSLSPEISFMM